MYIERYINNTLHVSDSILIIIELSCAHLLMRCVCVRVHGVCVVLCIYVRRVLQY